MRKRLSIFFALAFILNSITSTQREVMDEVVAFVIGESGVQPLCRLQECFPNPMGMIERLPDKIFRMVWLSYADTYGLKARMQESMNEYAEQYLDMLQDERGVTRDKLSEMCQELGYTLNDLKHELDLNYLLHQAAELGLSSRGLLHVSPAEIEKYYHDHPQVVPLTYTLRRGIVKNKNNISWEPTYSVKEKDLSELFKNIKNLPDGSLIETQVKEEGRPVVYEVVGRKEEHIVPLQDRYDEIAQILHAEKYQKAYGKVTYELLQDSSVIFNDLDLKQQVEDLLKK